MNEHTPTTEQIKKLVTDWLDVGGEVTPEAFDRWFALELAKHAQDVLWAAVRHNAYETGVSHKDYLGREYHKVARWIRDNAPESVA